MSTTDGLGGMRWEGAQGDGPRVLCARTPAGLVAFSSRHDGASTGPFASLNVAFHVGDEPDAVRRNRLALSERLAVDPERMTFVRQVHGTDVVVVGEDVVGAGRDGVSPLEADALVSDRPGVSLAVLVADCVPVLVLDGVRAAAAAVHAGWRGVMDGVLPAAIEAIRRRYDSDPGDLAIWIGPHARACCYEVDEELANRFARRFGSEVVKDGRRVNLEACLARQWTAAGVAGRQVASVRLCTVCETQRFFSHRAAGGGPTGRFAGLVSLAP